MKPYELNVTSMGKPRMTQRDRWAKRPVVERYYRTCEAIRNEAERTGAEVTDTLRVKFYIAMPKSWSKKKRAEYDGRPHQSKPDIDNLVKTVLDALLEDDSVVYRVEAEKYWSTQSQITILL